MICRLCGKHSMPPELRNSWFSSSRICTPAPRHEFESEGSCQKNLTLPRVCTKDVFFHLHYSVWQLTGSCPDVPAVSALLSVKQCSQTYADDAVLFAQDPGRWQAELKRFDDAAATMGLHISWVKTKLQNIGYGPPPQSASVDGHLVEVTHKFVYLGSTVNSTGYSSTDILRWLGLASSVMGQLDRVWRQNRLSLATKPTCVLAVGFYGAETWTLLKKDSRRLYRHSTWHAKGVS